MLASSFLFEAILLPAKAKPKTDTIFNSGMPIPLDDEDSVLRSTLSQETFHNWKWYEP